MQTPTKIDISEVVDKSRIGGFQIRIYIICALGVIMPNAMTLVGEYSPRRLRILLMMLISNGFNAGAVLGGFLSASLIPAFGWRSVFYFGGAIPFVIALLMFFSLPESLQFLALRGKSAENIATWLKRIDHTVPSDSGTTYVVHEEKSAGLPIVHLFLEGRVSGTIVLW